MSERTEGVYNGTWCAICETPFTINDAPLMIPNESYLVHRCCHDFPGECEHSEVAKVKR